MLFIVRDLIFLYLCWVDGVADGGAPKEENYKTKIV
jgi:hypothetical protein